MKIQNIIRLLNEKYSNKILAVNLEITGKKNFSVVGYLTHFKYYYISPTRGMFQAHYYNFRKQEMDSFDTLDALCVYRGGRFEEITAG